MRNRAPCITLWVRAPATPVLTERRTPALLPLRLMKRLTDRSFLPLPLPLPSSLPWPLLWQQRGRVLQQRKPQRCCIFQSLKNHPSAASAPGHVTCTVCHMVLTNDKVTTRSRAGMATSSSLLSAVCGTLEMHSRLLGDLGQTGCPRICPCTRRCTRRELLHDSVGAGWGMGHLHGRNRGGEQVVLVLAALACRGAAAEAGGARAAACAAWRPGCSALRPCPLNRVPLGVHLSRLTRPTDCWERSRGIDAIMPTVDFSSTRSPAGAAGRAHAWMTLSPGADLRAGGARNRMDQGGGAGEGTSVQCHITAR